MSKASTPVATLGPIEPRKRIKEVDMVRGFALFGVLLVNMFNFGAYSIIWTEPADEFAFSVMRFFFETKSWRLFSFLFGFGFALQLIRAEKRGAKFAPVYLRRMIILFVVGMGHALFYDGDILMLFAELGLVLVLFRKLPPKLLLILSVMLLAVFPIGRAATSLFQQTGIEAPTDDAVRLKEALAEIEEDRRTYVYSIGSMRDVMVDNAHLKNPFARPLGPESSLARFAMFLLGLYVGRRRIFHDIPKHINLIRRVFWWGLSIGLVSMSTERILNATTGYAVFREQQATILPQLFGDILFVYGSTALSLGYAAAITLLAQHVRGSRLLSPLGAAGRLALTVYLSGSLMFTTLFYGYAFGNVFWLGPAAVTAWAILFFAILIAAAVWWANRFRFGPIEWLWRSLSYWRIESIRLHPQVSGADRVDQ